jgi:hypothetical protein
MAKHEKHCTANPDRECKMCGCKGAYKEAIEQLRKRYNIVEVKDSPDFDSLKVEWTGLPVTLEEILNITDGCPACALSIIRLSGMNHWYFEWGDKWYEQEKSSFWAVFFDEMDIKWIYEYEGYDLGKPFGFYLPDFFLPGFDKKIGCFAEVKGEKFNELELKKCEVLSKLTKNSVIILDGIPEVKAHHVFYYDENYNTNDLINCLIKGDCAYEDNRLFYCPGYENLDLSIPDEYKMSVGYEYIKAVEKAKSYRF